VSALSAAEPQALEGRRIVVTGASTGIGEAIALRALRAGARVAGVARNEERLRAGLARHGATVVVADLTDPEQCSSAIERAAHELGGIDVLINNAGVFLLGLLESGRYDEWRRMFDLNVLAVLATGQAALPHLKASSAGQVVNVGSIGGRRVAGPASAVYSASKYALVAVTEGMRQELQPHGIKVALVSPGVVRTGIGGEIRDEAEAERVRRNAEELGIEPGEVAEAVLFVVSRPPGTSAFELTIAPTSQLT
jgi:NADP-dependent 3-hydroxy acid dehydrogenase YdfG